MSNQKAWLIGTALAVGIAATASARAEITIGANVASTGPAAALGIPQRNAYALLPKSVAGVKVRYVILEDGCDPRIAVQNVKKLIEQYKADVILGSPCTPSARATMALAAEAKTPQISVAPIPTQRFGFSATAPNSLMVGGVVEHMKRHGAKTIGFITYSDALGDDLNKNLVLHAKKQGLKIVASERYGRTDTSVTGQVLKILAARPDVVFVGASGTPAILPHAELRRRGYRGKIYHTHATVIAPFIKVGGKVVEGAIMPTGPITVAGQLANANPIKPTALKFVDMYEKKYGKGSSNFIAGSAWDGAMWAIAAAPAALKKAKPGTEAFRLAMRDALENLKNVVGSTTIATLGPTDHFGLDARSRVMVVVKDGKFQLLED